MEKLIYRRSAGTLLTALLGAMSLTGLALEPAKAVGEEPYIGVWGLPVLPGWTLRFGLQGLLFPAYEGAKKYLLWPLPSFEVDYNDRLYLNTTAGTYAIFQNKWVSIGPEITPFLGRQESYSDALKGLGNLPVDLKGGAFVGFHSPVGSLVVECSRSMTTSVGATGSVSFQSGYLFDPKRLILAVTPGVTWADQNYMQHNFGITPTQSANSGYSIYSPSAGFYNYWINIAPTFIVHTRHYIIPSFAYIRLFDEARRSPLVTGPGTPNQYVAQLSYQYLF
jgi:outer membrane protein